MKTRGPSERFLFSAYVLFIVAIMNTMNDSRNTVKLDNVLLSLAFDSLAMRLVENHTPPIELVVCGGSALIALGLVARSTKDVDVVALIRDGILCTPAPLPSWLLQAAVEVAEDLGLEDNWLNNGPSQNEVDQIHFKLYASADRGGYHDLLQLSPSSDELEAAARWAMTHDVSEGFAMVLKGLLEKLGHDGVAARL